MFEIGNLFPCLRRQKQEMEQRNHAIYSYMHALFGAEVIDMFDMKYNPEQLHRI
mgnify:CR=1 FL=1